MYQLRANCRCFYVNLPVGACVVLVISLLYRPPKQPKEHNSNALDKLKTLDPIGFILFVPAVVCLLLALQLSGSQDSWGDARVIALLVLCSVFTASFVASQIWLKEAATVPPRLIRQRTVAFAAVFAMWYVISRVVPSIYTLFKSGQTYLVIREAAIFLYQATTVILNFSS